MAQYETMSELTDTISSSLMNGQISQITADALLGILGGITLTGDTVPAVESTGINSSNIAGIDAVVAFMKAPSADDASNTPEPQMIRAAGDEAESDADTAADSEKPTGQFNAVVPEDSPLRAVFTAVGVDSNDITFQTNQDVVVALAGGKGDSVTTSGGDDVVAFVGGKNSSATINTGDGNDIVDIRYFSPQDNGGSALISLGDGNDRVAIKHWEGNATINGGDGFDQVNMTGSRADHAFSYAAGNFTMDNRVNMSSVNVVTFDSDGSDAVDSIDHITVLAETAGDAIVAKLYQVALGREAIDNCSGTNGQAGADLITGALGGISYWTEYFNQGTNSGADLQKTVYDFLGSGEFQKLYCGMDDETFVTQLFHNLDKADPNFDMLTTINGKTIQDFVNQLDGTQEARWDVAWEIASSDQADQILGQDGIGYVIEDPGLNDGPQSA